MLWELVDPFFILVEREPVAYADCSWFGINVAFDLIIGMPASNKLQGAHHFFADGLVETILEVFKCFSFPARVDIVFDETEKVVSHFFNV